MAALSVIRDYLEEILDIQEGDDFIDSTYEDQLIQKAYEKTGIRYDWPHHRVRAGEVAIAKVDRYTLPTDFRKFRFLFSLASEKEETETHNLPFGRLRYTVERDTSEFILQEAPQTASTPYTTSNGETAGSAVVIELDTVSGLIPGETIFIKGTIADEFTVIQSVDESAVTITVKLANNTTAADILYKLNEIIYYQYYITLDVLVSASVPNLPDELHFTLAHYAAYLYYKSKKQDDKEAANNLEIWNQELKDYWLAYDKSSTGIATKFSA